MRKRALLFTSISLIFCSILESRSEPISDIKIEKTVTRPVSYFKSDPSQIIPPEMVIQGFTVNYQIVDLPKGSKVRYTLVRKEGAAKLLNRKSTNNWSSKGTNSLLCDGFGSNIIKIEVKDKKNIEMRVAYDTVRVHFSRSQVAGGDITNLNEKLKGTRNYQTGIFDTEDYKIEKGMRFFPSDCTNIDTLHTESKDGFYLTKEPRLLYVKNSGTLISTYHMQVKGVNDAPPGLTFVVTRSDDGGVTWSHDKVILHHRNAVIGYTALAQVDNTIQLYFTAGHPSHRQYNKYVGVFRVVSSDDGRTWSAPEKQIGLSKLINGSEDNISDGQALICNALQIPQMEWRGKRADAILLAFYVSPIKFVISQDKGKTWEIFAQSFQYKNKNICEINEMSWVSLPDSTIYVVSRKQSHKGFKKEMFFDWNGAMNFYGEELENHKSRRCHHGARIIPQGEYKDRVVLVSNWSGDREEGTVAISSDSKARNFETRLLTHKTGFGYCDVVYDMKRDGFVVVAESEPYDSDQNSIPMDKAVDRNERFSVQSYNFSLDYYNTLKVLKSFKN